MTVFIVELNGERRDGRGQHSFPWEVPHSSQAELNAALEKGPVLGNQLVYDSIPGSEVQKKIRRRMEVTLSKSGIASIKDARSEFI